MLNTQTVTRFWRHPRVSSVRHFVSPTRWYRYATSHQRRLPDFIIAGTQKGGTTSLHRYLSQHPQILSVMIKEVHYFDQNHHFGERWYRMFFPLASKCAPNQICGEATPMYMFCPQSPERMAQLVPNVKLVVLLRNPVNRAYSHYQQVKNLSIEKLSFEEAVAAEPARTAGERSRLIQQNGYASWNYRWYSYLERGIYAPQIQELRKHFPSQNLLFVQSEKYFTETRAVLAQVLDFLGLDRWEWPDFGKRTVKNRPKLLPETREQLTEYFAPHNERLFAELGYRYDW